MREFSPRVSKGLLPNLLVLKKGAITSLSLFNYLAATGHGSRLHILGIVKPRFR